MTRTKSHRSLTTEEKEQIKVMLAEGRSCHAVARELKRDPKTIRRYAMEPRAAQEVMKMRGELADMFEDVAKRNLVSITNEDIKAVSSYQRTLSAAVATDKMRLLRGEITENINVLVGMIRDVQARRREEALLEEGSQGQIDQNPDPAIPPNHGSQSPEE